MTPGVGSQKEAQRSPEGDKRQLENGSEACDWGTWVWTGAVGGLGDSLRSTHCGLRVRTVSSPARDGLGAAGGQPAQHGADVTGQSRALARVWRAWAWAGAGREGE